jgi:hypothetical protein
MRQYPRLVPMAVANNRRTQASIAEGVARRTGLNADDLYPRALASAAHAVALAALAQWNTQDPGSDLLAILDTSFEMAASGFPAP